MPHNTKILRVHIHCIADDYSLSVLFIMIWVVLVSSMLFIALQSYIQSYLFFPQSHFYFLSLVFPFTVVLVCVGT
jgi:hypothetical protein